jgi:conjugal transfer pilus assembly protein TraL
MEARKIPKSIDDPLKLIIWDIRDVAPLVICLMIGIAAGNLTLFTIIGIGFAAGSRKFRERRQDGWAIHALYWIGLLPLKLLPNPFVREYYP